LDLILSKSGNEIQKGLLGNLKFANCFRECNEDRSRRPCIVAVPEVRLEIVEQLEALDRVAGLIGQIIRRAAIGIDVVEMPPEAARDEEIYEMEVLVASLGQPSAELAGLGEGNATKR
jgi:hypothetical protein